MDDIRDWFEKASRHHRAGDLAAAESLYRRILTKRPRHPETLYRLGVMKLRQGSPGPAVRFLRKAVATRPNYAEAHLQLGLALHAQGKSEPSLAALRKARNFDPRSAEIRFHLATVLEEQGVLDEAAVEYRSSLELRPEFAAAANNLGNVLRRQGNFDEALAWFTRASELQPSLFQAHHNRGAILQARGLFEEAIPCFRTAAELEPRFAEAERSLAVCLAKLKRHPEATEAFQRALRLQPNSAIIHRDRGMAFYDQENFDEAITHYRKAVELDPKDTVACERLGNALLEQDRIDESRACFLRLARRQPDNPLWTLHAQTLCPALYADTEEIDRYRSDLGESLEAARQADWNLTPELLFEAAWRPHFNLPFQGRDDRPIKQAFGEFFDRFFPKERPAFGSGPPRVGFVVTNDQEALFARLFSGVFGHFTPGVLEPVLLCTPAGKALLQPRIRSPEVRWHLLPGGIEETVQSIREGRFDVLFFRSIGTTALSYFLPFYRLAPIQCTTWGIQVTSGIPAIDYYISSDLIEPEDAADHYTEELVRQKTLLAYVPRLPRPARARKREFYGLPTGRHLYFCAQQLGKFHPQFDELLGEILRADPLGNVVITRGRRRGLVEKLRARFDARLPDVADRILFVPNQRGEDYSNLLLQADVLLDPIHFGGVNTGYDAFSLGKPVVTLPSRYHRGRYTLGCYRRMGIDECIAGSRDEYVHLAIRIATDRSYRDDLEKRLFSASEVLFEDPEIPRELERLLLEIVERGRRE